MDEDLSIINANTRNEKIKNYIIKNKSKFLIVIIVFITIIIGVFSYDKHINNKKKEISDKFNLITIEYNENAKKKTASRLIEIINKKDPTYSPLSLYFIIDNNLIKETNKINLLFDILIKDTKLDTEIKNLVMYKKALYNADKAQESDLLKMLNPIINSNSVWKSHALYLMAEYFYVKDQKQKSKEFFNQILALEDSNLDIKLQAEKRLNRDLGE
tara:strand:+ start:274 stop:918 length:645 start_codon:yes stop_codon:yes gene_type:complete